MGPRFKTVFFHFIYFPSQTKKKIDLVGFCSDALVYSDKTYDMFSIKLSDLKNEKPSGSFLLGHLGMITDFKWSADEKYLITCERDEKIRVSFYPGAYEIHNVLLGHETFVSNIVPVDKYLISSSVDGVVIVWEFANEKSPLCDKVNLEKSVYGLSHSRINGNDYVSVLYESEKIISILCLVDGKLMPFEKLEFKHNVCDVRFQGHHLWVLLNNSPNIQCFDFENGKLVENDLISDMNKKIVFEMDETLLNKDQFKKRKHAFPIQKSDRIFEKPRKDFKKE